MLGREYGGTASAQPRFKNWGGGRPFIQLQRSKASIGEAWGGLVPTRGRREHRKLTKV